MRRTDGNLRTLAAAQSGVVNIDAAAGTNSTATRLTMRNRTSIGIDFGTANTVVAIAKPGEAVRAITFHDDREKNRISTGTRCASSICGKSVKSKFSASLKAIEAYLTSACGSASSVRAQARQARYRTGDFASGFRRLDCLRHRPDRENRRSPAVDRRSVGRGDR
jgi:hypothetical protein